VLFEDEAGHMGYTTLEDISPRKEAEAELKRLYDAQETVLHLIAHDLKAPLANIQMLVDVLQRDETFLSACPPSTQAESLGFLAMIEQACQEANLLLLDVLFLGELDVRPLEKQRTNLNEFLEERLRVHRLAAKQQNQKLTLRLPGHVVYAALHPGKFSRALDNLLTNALKFTPQGGRIDVELLEYEGHARLRVQDTGVGIPADLQEQVFDKFSQAARAGLYGTTSTGLGLFITRQIVQLHGGKIWLESQEGKGTSFFIDLF
jgi:two-component system sensor histidine kinase VicK